MILKTKYIAPVDLIPKFINFEENKTQINQPSNDFFYDPWYLKDEFKNTIWEELLSTLNVDIGEARIIKLPVGKCYQQHADIDDRYHLNLSGDNSVLINLENNEIYKMKQDGVWYEMDAGIIHSAINFGQEDRYQIVVRKLLLKNHLINPYKVSIELSGCNPRFVFDNSISKWLNRSNKIGVINKFSHYDNTVEFFAEKFVIDQIEKILPKDFKIYVDNC